MPVYLREPLAGYSGAEYAAALFTLTVLVGLFQIGAGLLKLGRLMRFVSNAVMIGFLSGVSVLIVLSQLGDFTGYASPYSNKVVKAADILLHPGDWDPTTTVIGVGTIVLAFALKAVRQLDRYALVLVVAIGLVGVLVTAQDDLTIRFIRGDQSVEIQLWRHALHQASDGDEATLLGLTAAAQGGSEHPLGGAVARRAAQRQVLVPVGVDVRVRRATVLSRNKDIVAVTFVERRHVADHHGALTGCE